MARRYDLPWRSSNATASNVVDAQAAYESQMAIWGAIMGGVSLLYQGAGWLEGGLTASFEKLILDAEMLQMMAEVLVPFTVDDAEIGLEAMAEVGPGGHHFATSHTLERYETRLLPADPVRLAELRDLARGRRKDGDRAGEPDLAAAPRRVRAAAARPGCGGGVGRVRGSTASRDRGGGVERCVDVVDA